MITIEAKKQLQIQLLVNSTPIPSEYEKSY
jgi:hypothetical protein